MSTSALKLELSIKSVSEKKSYTTSKLRNGINKSVYPAIKFPSGTAAHMGDAGCDDGDVPGGEHQGINIQWHQQVFRSLFMTFERVVRA
ncbi:hypothetical protein DCAR_0624372 [Daucus carota subsp. sativus]|uniref:Uncharacterized protein n=1 Tax=Daucus carota subsp. sativus TaxID=79200 RepID=A0AAF0XBW3_DAUCS|nr:hypothetical protein DCAR_0624372 [Daucus carota subsp. sativus]